MSLAEDAANLGLSVDDLNVASIKSAYATRLKVTRPDEKPQEFMELRRAYENLIAYLTYQHDVTHFDAPVSSPHDAPVFFSATPPNQVDNDSVVTRDAPLPTGATEANTPYNAHAQIMQLWESPWGRSSVKQLDTILRDAEMSGIEEFAWLSEDLFFYVMDATEFGGEEPYPLIPKWLNLDVLNTLNHHFAWHDQSINPYIHLGHLKWLSQVQIALEYRANDRMRSGRATAFAPRPSFSQESAPQPTAQAGGRAWRWVQPVLRIVWVLAILVAVMRILPGLTG